MKVFWRLWKSESIHCRLHFLFSFLWFRSVRWGCTYFQIWFILLYFVRKALFANIFYIFLSVDFKEHFDEFVFKTSYLVLKVANWRARKKYMHTRVKVGKELWNVFFFIGFFLFILTWNIYKINFFVMLLLFSNGFAY